MGSILAQGVLFDDILVGERISFEGKLRVVKVSSRTGLPQELDASFGTGRGTPPPSSQIANPLAYPLEQAGR